MRADEHDGMLPNIQVSLLLYKRDYERLNGYILLFSIGMPPLLKFSFLSFQMIIECTLLEQEMGGEDDVFEGDAFVLYVYMFSLFIL